MIARWDQIRKSWEVSKGCICRIGSIGLVRWVRRGVCVRESKGVMGTLEWCNLGWEAVLQLAGGDFPLKNY